MTTHCVVKLDNGTLMVFISLIIQCMFKRTQRVIKNLKISMHAGLNIARQAK